MPPANDYRTAVEITRLFHSFEQTYDLLQFKVDGWSIWPKLRFRLIRRMQNIPANRQVELPGIRERLRILEQDAHSILTGTPTDCLINTFSTARSEVENGRYKDIYFDDLLPHLSSYVKIEDINNKKFHQRSNNALIPSDLTTLWLGFMVDHLVRSGFPSGFRGLSVFLADLIRKELGLEISGDSVNNSFLEFYWAKRVYKKLIQRFEPKCLLLANTNQVSITAAARECGTTVIEFQHGFLDRFHPGYSWSAYARNHKASMPVPDHLFLYGTHWQSELSATGFWERELHSVGSLRMDRHHRSRRDRDGRPLRIVLTTQGVDTARLIDFISEFAAMAQNINYEMYVKLHPIFDNDAVAYHKAWHMFQNIHVIAGDQLPDTYTLISSAQLHFSIFSTCHYEALGLGVPTVILGLAGHENVLHLEKQGAAMVARSPFELLKLVEFPQELKFPAGTVDAYFKPDALKNILSELASLGVRSNEPNSGG